MRTDIKRYSLFLVILGALLLLVSCNNGSPDKTSSSKTPGKPAAPSGQAAPEGTEAPETPQEGDHSMQVLNEPPVINNIKFAGESSSSAQVVVEASDPAGEPVTLRYAWTVNGEAVEADGDTVTGLKRGDKIQVLVTPNDGRQDGAPKALFAIITNHPPKIEPSQPQYDDPHWTLQIKATDADGDSLQYSLVKAPTGMTVSNSGLISWDTTGADAGKHTATVAVSDGQPGGSTQWSFDVVLGPTPAPTVQ